MRAFLNEHAGRWSLKGQRSKARQVNLTELSVRFSSFFYIPLEVIAPHWEWSAFLKPADRQSTETGAERSLAWGILSCVVLRPLSLSLSLSFFSLSHICCASGTGAWRHRFAVRRGGHGNPPCRTMLKLSCWVSGTNLSTLVWERARPHPIGEPK